MVITKRLGASLKLTRETKISDLLKAYPEMIEILARYNKHFELLRQPALRKLAQSVERGIRQLAGVISANVEVVWGPAGTRT